MPPGAPVAASFPTRGAAWLSNCWREKVTRQKLSIASCIATCTRCPRPVRERWMTADRIDTARCSPVPVSPMVAPGRIGRPSRSPVMLITPPVACAIMSNERKSACGPSSANPLTWAKMQRGLMAWISSHPNPSFSIVPGAKFSITTSARSMSRRRRSLPAVRLEVAGDRTLVRVEEDEVERVHVGALGDREPSRVPPPRLLDLDDVRAVPRQRLGAGGARLELGEIDHGEPG